MTQHLQKILDAYMDHVKLLQLEILLKYEPPHDKTNKMTVHPAKTQISLGICPVWSESSLCAQWVAKDPGFLYADSEDSDQTADTQADLSPRLVHMLFCCFFHEVAHISYTRLQICCWFQGSLKVTISKSSQRRLTSVSISPKNVRCSLIMSRKSTTGRDL